MKKAFWVLLLGLCSNTSSAVGRLREMPVEDKSTLLDTEETQKPASPQFTNLVKSTMELMRPDLEVSQATEVTVHAQE